MSNALIFDMDGTLNRCAEYYKDAITAFAELNAEKTALPVEMCRRVLEEIDLATTVLPDAFKRHRFPRSFRAASLALDTIAERPLDMYKADRSYAIGDAVFDAEYALYDGVYDLLTELKQHWLLVLVTKGDWGVQWQKIHQNKLDKLFEYDNIFVTLKKSPEFLQHVVDRTGVDITSSWVIGDSLKDDIWPGQVLGLKTCWVTQDEKWSYNDHEHAKPDEIVHTVSEFRKYALQPV